MGKNLAVKGKYYQDRKQKKYTYPKLHCFLRENIQKYNHTDSSLSNL